MSELINTKWLYENLNSKKLVILDCSWSLPSENKNHKKVSDKIKNIQNIILRNILKDHIFLILKKLLIQKINYHICCQLKIYFKKK